MIANIFISIVGILTFLFVFWKRLVNDYLPNQIFTTAVYMLLGIFIGYFISFRFFPLWWFWTTFAGIVLGLILGVIRYNLRFFETIEAAIIGFSPWLAMLFFTNSVVNYSGSSFIGFAIILGLIGIFYYLDTHYKSFAWYASGKVGFSGLIVLGIFFAIRAATSYFFPSVLSLSGKYDIWLSGIVAFGLFLLVFNLARRIS